MIHELYFDSPSCHKQHTKLVCGSVPGWSTSRCLCVALISPLFLSFFALKFFALGINSCSVFGMLSQKLYLKMLVLLYYESQLDSVLEKTKLICFCRGKGFLFALICWQFQLTSLCLCWFQKLSSSRVKLCVWPSDQVQSQTRTVWNTSYLRNVVFEGNACTCLYIHKQGECVILTTLKPVLKQLLNAHLWQLTWCSNIEDAFAHVSVEFQSLWLLLSLIRNGDR